MVMKILKNKQTMIKPEEYKKRKAVTTIYIFVELLSLLTEVNCYTCDTTDGWLSGHSEAVDGSVASPLEKWPNGVVHYKFDSNLTSTENVTVHQAFDEYERKTCIRFVPWREPIMDYVSIQISSDPNLCGKANVCKIGGKQIMKISKNCWSTASLIHQLGHILCLAHEHQRLDRDNRLTFRNCSLTPNKTGSPFGSKVPFDYASQMHSQCNSCEGGWPMTFGGKAFVACGQDITAGLSVLDVDSINAMYNCQACHRHRWVSTTLLTPDDKANMYSFGNSELYACRVPFKEEIVSGVYDVLNKACHIYLCSFRDICGLEIRQHVEVLTIPQGAQADCSKYEMADRSVASFNSLVPVGTSLTKRNWKSFIAYGSVKGHTVVGTVWWADAGGLLSQAQFWIGKTSEYQVMTCRVDTTCIIEKSKQNSNSPNKPDYTLTLELSSNKEKVETTTQYPSTSQVYPPDLDNDNNRRILNEKNASAIIKHNSNGTSSFTNNTIDQANTSEIISNSEMGTYTTENQSNHLNTTSSSSNPQDDSSTGTDIVVILLIVFLPLLLILSLITLCHIRRLRKANEILSQADIIQFQEGTPPSLTNEDEIENPFCGEIRGIKFNSKYELKKTQIHIDTNKILGAGKFGIVYKGTVEKMEAAIKMPNDNCTKQTFKSFLSEVIILCYLGTHEHLLKLIGAYVAEIRFGVLHIATEFCANGSLLTFLRKRKHVIQTAGCNAPGFEEDETVSFSELCSFSFQIARGMEYIASMNIVHGDLSTRNVFLGEGNICKIGDFGLSRKLEEYEVYVKHSLEPIPWKWWAYESLAKREFTCKSDVWGFGVTVWEIFSLGHTPYEGLNWTPQFLVELDNGMRLPQPRFATPEIYAKLQDCWILDPEIRTTCINMAECFKDACNTDYIQLDELPLKDVQNEMCTSTI